MYSVTLTSRFQITIPKKLREDLHLKPGQLVVFNALGNALRLVPKCSLTDSKDTNASSNIDNIRDIIK